MACLMQRHGDMTPNNNSVFLAAILPDDHNNASIRAISFYAQGSLLCPLSYDMMEASHVHI